MPSTQSKENGFPDELGRIAAFTEFLVEGLMIWRRQGRPSLKILEAKVRRAAPAEKQESEDLRAIIASVLGEEGPQRPGAIERRVGRSHKTVFYALQWLTRANVVVATGRTKGRRYSAQADWRNRLSDALRADAQQQLDSHPNGESSPRESQKK